MHLQPSGPKNFVLPHSNPDLEQQLGENRLANIDEVILNILYLRKLTYGTGVKKHYRRKINSGVIDFEDLITNTEKPNFRLLIRRTTGMLLQKYSHLKRI